MTDKSFWGLSDFYVRLALLILFNFIFYWSFNCFKRSVKLKNKVLWEFLRPWDSPDDNYIIFFISSPVLAANYSISVFVESDFLVIASISL